MRERWTIIPCYETEDFEPGNPPLLTPVKADAAADVFVVKCNGQIEDIYKTRAEAEAVVRGMKAGR